MHHAAGMSAIKGISYLLTHGENLLFREWTSLQLVSQGFANHILHDQEIGFVLCVEIVDDCNVRVIEFS